MYILHVATISNICKPVETLTFSIKSLFSVFLALTTNPSCTYNGLQIDDGDVFRPSNMLDDFTSTQSTRNECEECICTVSNSLYYTHANCYRIYYHFFIEYGNNLLRYFKQMSHPILQ